MSDLLEVGICLLFVKVPLGYLVVKTNLIRIKHWLLLGNGRTIFGACWAINNFSHYFVETPPHLAKYSK
jgi:hypothetical protein